MELQENLSLTDHLSTQFAYPHNDSEQELSVKNMIRIPATLNNQVSVYCQFSNENLLNGLHLRVGGIMWVAPMRNSIIQSIKLVYIL